MEDRLAKGKSVRRRLMHSGEHREERLLDGLVASPLIYRRLPRLSASF